MKENSVNNLIIDVYFRSSEHQLTFVEQGEMRVEDKRGHTDDRTI